MKRWHVILLIPFLVLHFCGCHFEEDALKPVPVPEQNSSPGETLQVIESSIVTFSDINLENAVRNSLYIEGIRRKDKDLLEKPLDDPITKSDLAKLTILEATGKNISSLQGLEYCENLKELYLSDNQISSVHYLSSLTNLTKLNLGANKIRDVSPLASLDKLTELDLYVNSIEDISPLSSLTALTNLYLFRNQISDISPLANLTNLVEVDLYANQITDVSPLLDNTGLGEGDIIRLAGNNLDLVEGSKDMADIELLLEKGVVVVLE